MVLQDEASFIDAMVIECKQTTAYQLLRLGSSAPRQGGLTQVRIDLKDGY